MATRKPLQPFYSPPKATPSIALEKNLTRREACNFSRITVGRFAQDCSATAESFGAPQMRSSSERLRTCLGSKRVLQGSLLGTGLRFFCLVAFRGTSFQKSKDRLEWKKDVCAWQMVENNDWNLEQKHSNRCEQSTTLQCTKHTSRAMNKAKLPARAHEDC